MVRRQAQQKRPSMIARSLLKTGSGGGIRTPDLWVMSPTSCRCSTPRRVLAPGSRRSATHSCSSWPSRRLAVCGGKVRGARGGLASRGVAPTVLSGAALGHDRVRDGTGWGQHALGHGHPSPPHQKGGTLLLRHTTAGTDPRSCPVAHAPCISPSMTFTGWSGAGGFRPLAGRGRLISPVEVSSPPAGTGRPDAAPRHRM